jgi:hypothetical protein
VLTLSTMYYLFTICLLYTDGSVEQHYRVSQASGGSQYSISHFSDLLTVIASSDMDSKLQQVSTNTA